jgi:predicted XRE-type DNA-binding protein
MKLILESFNEHVQKGSPNECWNWTGTKHKAGYGVVHKDGKTNHRVWAHHIAWMLHYRKSIPENKIVLHKCDNPSCCNPRHLYVGTPADNARDRDLRGRFTVLRGEQNGNAILTKRTVLKIRKLLRESNMSQCAIAEEFNIACSTMSAIKQGKLWGWLK